MRKQEKILASIALAGIAVLSFNPNTIFANSVANDLDMEEDSSQYEDILQDIKTASKDISKIDKKFKIDFLDKATQKYSKYGDEKYLNSLISDLDNQYSKYEKYEKFITDIEKYKKLSAKNKEIIKKYISTVLAIQEQVTALSEDNYSEDEYSEDDSSVGNGTVSNNISLQSAQTQGSNSSLSSQYPNAKVQTRLSPVPPCTAGPCKVAEPTEGASICLGYGSGPIYSADGCLGSGQAKSPAIKSSGVTVELNCNLNPFACIGAQQRGDKVIDTYVPLTEEQKLAETCKTIKIMPVPPADLYDKSYGTYGNPFATAQNYAAVENNKIVEKCKSANLLGGSNSSQTASVPANVDTTRSLPDGRSGKCRVLPDAEAATVGVYNAVKTNLDKTTEICFVNSVPTFMYVPSIEQFFPFGDEAYNKNTLDTIEVLKFSKDVKANNEFLRNGNYTCFPKDSGTNAGITDWLNKSVITSSGPDSNYAGKNVSWSFCTNSTTGVTTPPVLYSPQVNATCYIALESNTTNCFKGK